jgi:hypothetical protein
VTGKRAFKRDTPAETMTAFTTPGCEDWYRKLFVPFLRY